MAQEQFRSFLNRRLGFFLGSEPKLLREIIRDRIDRDAFLIERVAVANGHGVVREGVAVDREAERATGFVHAGVALADRLLGVELAHKTVAQVQVQLLRDLRHPILIHQREDAGLHRRHMRRECQHTLAALSVGRRHVRFADQHHYPTSESQNYVEVCVD